MAKIKKFFMMQVTTIVFGMLVLTATALIADWGVVGTGTGNTDDVYTDGNVSIGNSSPLGRFEVVSSSLDKWIGRFVSSNSVGVGGFHEDSNGDVELLMYKTTDIVRIATDGNSYLLGGNLGIGLKAPNSKVHIYGNNVNTDPGELILETGAGDNPKWGLTAGLKGITNAQFGIYDYTNSVYRLMISTATGNVGIGLTNPSAKLHVNGTIRAESTIAAAQYECSDARYKHSVTPISHALRKLMALNGVFYSWRTEKFKEMNFSKDRQLGFIAQEVEKVIPELVHTDSKGYKSMSYNKLTAVIVEAMKEMKSKSDEKISSLEKENETLKKRIASLEKVNDRVAALERMVEGKRVVLR